MIINSPTGIVLVGLFFFDTLMYDYLKYLL